MKNIRFITLITLLMAAVTMQAQQFEPLVAEGKQWNVVYTYVPWPPVHRVTDAYKVEGDTVVEGTVYKKLLTTQSQQYTNWGLCGLMRETDEGQVFYRSYGSNHTFGAETMLYDFSMQPGDSIYYNQYYGLVLLRKSDTILDDGNIRKRLDFQYKEEGYLEDKYETWIEGIGSELGLLHAGSLSMVGGTYDLLCYYDDDDLIWHNPLFNSCYIDYHIEVGTKFFDQASGLYYIITSDNTVEVTYDVTHFNTYVGDIVIPETVVYRDNIYTVTAIGEAAFQGCEGQLNSIIVPGTVRKIDNWAFASSPRLSLIILPNTIDSIGQGAFSRSGITSLRLPEGITVLPEQLFAYCESLATVEIPSSVTRIEANAFEGSTINTISIPESVTYIGESAFKSCTRLTSIDIPNSVTEIGPSAFYYCLELQSARLPEMLEVIPESLFERCPSLSAIDIPATVTEIGKSAFCYTGIVEMVVPDAVQYIGDEAFLGCSRLSSITLPSHLVGISAGLFQDCTALHSITIPQSVICIFSNAFKQSGVASVTFEGSLDGLGSYAFSGCTNLRSIVLPITAHIGDAVFYNCSNLETAVIGRVVEIGTFAFGMCSALQTVTIMEETPPVDGGNVFLYCNDSVRLIVPCGAKEAYENSDWGNEVNYIIEDCGGLVGFTGAEWYYEILNDDGSITYQYLESAGDTVVNDKTVTIIIRTNTLYDKGGQPEVTREYIYAENNVVYWWNPILGEFTTLYDFSAGVDEEWEIKVGQESLTIHVDEVYNHEYKGQNYRVLRISDTEDLFSGTIVCGIGHLTSFFPERLMNRGKAYRVEGMRCFWREGELVFKYGDKDCDEVYQEYHNGIDEPIEAQFNLYPNPTHGILFVETCHGASLPDPTYRITNLMGQTVQTGSLNAETQQINVSDLPQGMYFISIGDSTRKFVVR